MLLGAIVAILALAGVFSNGDDEEPEPATTAPVDEADAADPPTDDGAAKPRATTVRVGGRPTAVSAGPDGVWVADSFSPRATVVPPGPGNPEPVTFRLEGPASDVTATSDGAWYALPEQQAVERRDVDDPSGSGEIVELDGFPAALAADGTTVFALSERAVEAIDATRGEVIDRFEVGGFGSGLAAADGSLWVVVDNREVVRLDAESGEELGEPITVREAFAIAASEETAWVVSASGEVTRIDSGSGAAAGATVREALDVASGLGSVWVTSSRRTLNELDPETLDPRGGRLRVGDEAASISVGDEAVWVANGGDGTLSRIEP